MSHTDRPSASAPIDTSVPTDPQRPTRRGLFRAQIVSNRPICAEHYRLRLRIAAGLAPTQPGQFIQLGCRPPEGSVDEGLWLDREHTWNPGGAGAFPEIGQPELCAPTALLRRPFSLAGRGDDGQGTWIDVIHRVVGVGTGWLAGLAAGDPIDLIGPLGNAFTWSDTKPICLLVGGGVGLPPMFYLAQALHKAGLGAVGFVGTVARPYLAVTLRDETPADPTGRPTACVSEFAAYGYKTVVTTDDGSVGLKGRITEGLAGFLQTQSAQEAAATVIYVCGPEPMMRAVAELAATHGVDCQVCVEQAMACGMGTCQSCIVRIVDPTQPPADMTGHPPAWRYKLACRDGPVFRSHDVVW